ncbi:hypothetical protein BDP27DRAFT_1448523 [Rhodocollybia butyracea]|uniref:Uncharacterized protein n=1 Tax=Rhodocollybia butyracea TaxID=206335 RepID=A0A9P5PTN7_9AGAR|nr:hypothetical protein BDP27DRAFT_1448523 [Rhodocollybia butyracea]
MATHTYTFPPFPPIPEGVTLIPFKDYKEKGIRIQEDSDEGPEVDGLGIPTIDLPPHKTDFCKTNSKRATNIPSIAVPPESQSLTWVQQWEDLGRRKSGEVYQSNDHRVDRLHQVTRAFNGGRTWPKTRHVREMWDQFQIFIGILNHMPIWKPKQEQKELEKHNDSDDEIDDEPELATESNETQPIAVADPGEVKALDGDFREHETDRTTQFLNNPARAVQIYLSSYLRKQGLHYNEANLTLIPHLVRFYMEFLLKDEVFKSEPETVASLEESRSIITLAYSQLPLTSEINKRLPWEDHFCEGCEKLFGVQAKQDELSRKAWLNTAIVDAPNAESTSSTAAATTSSTPVPVDVTLPELEMDTDAVNVDSDAPETPVQARFSANSFESVHTPVSDENPARDGILAANTLDPLDDSGEWGKSALLDSSGQWGMPEDLESSSDPWSIGNDANMQWVAKTLFPILGPTALPLTHTSGVVEWSMRRIQSISHPAEDAIPYKAIHEATGPSARAVEADLTSRLSQVVLEPWLEWEPSVEEDESTVPHIRGTSRGPVVVHDKGVKYENDSDVHSNALAALNIDLAHDPCKHSITLLLETENAKLLRVGMGLSGGWVQMARKTDLKAEEADEQNIEVDGPDSSEPGQRFWYLSNLLIVIPSYHVAGYD